jgi:DNA-binding CsgD family transcriptional regulator
MQGTTEVVAPGDEGGSRLAARTRPGDFGNEHADTLAALLSHFSWAARLQFRLRSAEVMADSATEVLDRLSQAVLLVRTNAQIAFANRAAETLLAARDGIRVDAGGLHAATAGQSAALHRLIVAVSTATAAMPNGGSLRIDRPSGRRPLSVLVAPICSAGRAAKLDPVAYPTAMVLITDPECAASGPAPERLRSLYGLTAAEAALAVRIVRGGGVKAAARALGIAPSTARTHLHQIFAKTGASGQAELAALLARLPIESGA